MDRASNCGWLKGTSARGIHIDGRSGKDIFARDRGGGQASKRDTHWRKNQHVRSREQSVSTAVTPASCNDQDTSKIASKNKESNESKKTRRGCPKDPETYKNIEKARSKQTSESTPFLAPRPQPMNSPQMHNVTPPQAKASQPFVTPKIQQTPQTPAVSTTNTANFLAEDKQAQTPVISAINTANFLSDHNQASVASGLTTESYNDGTTKFSSEREYSQTPRQTFHPHYYSSPKYNDTGSLAESFVSINEIDMPTKGEVPYVLIRTRGWPTYIVKSSHTDCGIVVKVGNWIEKLYIRKDNLNNCRPSGYWCCVICSKKPVPRLTPEGGEQRWNPRNGYFCLWNDTTDIPRYYKWDGKRQHWLGSARSTYRVYSKNKWRSSPLIARKTKEQNGDVTTSPVVNAHQYDFTINDKGQYNYDLTRLDEYQSDGWLIKDNDVDPDDVSSKNEGSTNEEKDELDMDTIKTTHVTVEINNRVRRPVVQIYVPGDEEMVDDYDKNEYENVENDEEGSADSIKTETYEDSDKEEQHECNHNGDEEEKFTDDVSGDSRSSNWEDDGYDIVNAKEIESSDYAPEEDSSSDDSSEGGDCNQTKITQYTRK
eukprot:scaffold5646_cov36-Cyclotella_meneghiniana.AAC.5